MKNLLLGTVAVLSLGAFVSTSHAADLEMPTSVGHEWYITGFGGAAFFDRYLWRIDTDYAVESEVGFIVGGAVGSRGLISENIRTEIEVSYMEASPSDFFRVPGATFVGANPTGHLSSVNILGNVWYDFAPNAAVQPYVGGGLGVGFVDGVLTTTNGDQEQFNGDDVGLAFQAGAGVRWMMSDSVGFDISYRFRGVMDVEFESVQGFASTGSDDILVHTIQAGISISMP